MDEYIPEYLILDTHKQGFNATKLITSPTEPDREWPDWQTKMKAVELGYKVRGHMDEKSQPSPITLNNLIQIVEHGKEDNKFITVADTSQTG